MPKRTPFYDFHLAAGAKLVDFAGWEMPLLYRSIINEHQQTRLSGSIFDVSHMGRLTFTGKDALPFLNFLLTRNLTDQSIGQSRYSLVCNDAGGILDDVIVSRDEQNWFLVCNASNRDKLLKHFAAVRKDKGFACDLGDITESTAMAAIQGPKVIERLANDLPIDLRSLKRYHFETATIMFIRVMIFRSGYTGEDGVEIVIPAKLAGMMMKMLGGQIDKPDALIRPAGLGARDTLRLEAAMPLYGHELSESVDPLCAGLAWAVDLNKDFLGAPPLRNIARQGPKTKLVGLVLDGKRIARQGTPLSLDGRLVGHVTSGTLSPTLQKSIALAYVDSNHAAEGATLSADLKASHSPATIIKLPFYKRTR